MKTLHLQQEAIANRTFPGRSDLMSERERVLQDKTHECFVVKRNFCGEYEAYKNDVLMGVAETANAAWSIMQSVN